MGMKREIYAENAALLLAEYLPEADDRAYFDCWQDPDTQAGYNYKMTCSLEEFSAIPLRSRFLAVIIRKEDGAPIGIVSLSPEGSEPDLAIMLYRPYRGQGCGTAAFGLAAEYCFERFGLEHIYAGCYETNAVSRKMLESLGFVPHPEGDQHESHYITEEPIIQYDFVLHRAEQK